MALTLTGSTGVMNPDGNATTPSITGSTSTTAGMFFPAANTVAFGTSVQNAYDWIPAVT